MADWTLSETAAAVLGGILVEKAWDRLPILADAVEESGCQDRSVLDPLRTNDPRLHGSWLERVVRGEVEAGQAVRAVDGLTAMAGHFRRRDYDAWDPKKDDDAPLLPSPGVQFLLDACDRYANGNEGRRWEKITVLNFDTPDEAYTMAGSMWEWYSTLTGHPPAPDENQWGDGELRPPSVFGCSC